MHFNRKLIIFSAFSLCAYISIVIASGLGWNPFGFEWNFSNPGAFGDAFGPLNSLMAALAATAALLAYQSQARELRRVEEQAESEKNARDKRDFEQTFFNLLTLFRETVNEIDVNDRYNQNPVSGRDALKRILEEYIGSPTGNDKSDRDAFSNSYRKFRDDLAHYFRLFYHILKYVENSNLKDKKLYTRLLRATLSDAEITLIALNCMHGGGKAKLKPLVEKFSMLHNISNHNFTHWRMSKYFDKEAFGERIIRSDGSLSD